MYRPLQPPSLPSELSFTLLHKSVSNFLNESFQTPVSLSVSTWSHLLFLWENKTQWRYSTKLTVSYPRFSSCSLWYPLYSFSFLLIVEVPFCLSESWSLSMLWSHTFLSQNSFHLFSSPVFVFFSFSTSFFLLTVKWLIFIIC